MPKTVRWGGVTLGEGMPKVCVPLTGGDARALRAAASRAMEAGADIVELRADGLSPMPDEGTALAACRAVRGIVGRTPILFTLRTARDGGPGSADVPAYEALLRAVCASGLCEAVDCEMSCGEAAFRRIVHAAHECGVSVVGSSHAFGGVSDASLAGEWLARQRALGADVVKAAVMARDDAEALELSRAMYAAARALDAPAVCIVMGPHGALSRVGAEFLGSCLSFGAAGEASAPGQMDARTLRALLAALHEARGGA